MLLGNKYRNKLHRKGVNKKTKLQRVKGTIGYRCPAAGRNEVVLHPLGLVDKMSFRNSDKKRWKVKK